VRHFGDQRIIFKVPRSNPRERDRVNAVNSRCCNVVGERRFMVDPSRAPHLVEDMDGTVVIKGGVGEIDKTGDPELSHISDAVGYYIHKEYPVGREYDKEALEDYWK
jgi:hypothetical protein